MSTIFKEAINLQENIKIQKKIMNSKERVLRAFRKTGWRS